MMLPSSRRIATCAVRQFIHPPSSLQSSSSIASIAVSRRYYAAKAHGPEPKLDPLSPPIPGELDPRFGDLPPWNVPEVNRQNMTETPVQPYYDTQNRRYFGEPLSEEDEMLGVFSYDVHNHVTLGFALKWFFGFAALFAGSCYMITYAWPGKITAPRTYPYNGLEKELGGPSNPARKDDTPQDGTE